MARFSVNVSSADSVASALQSEEEQIIASVKNIITLAEDMAQTWIGQAPDAFQAAQAQWNQGMDKMRVGMANAIQTLHSNVSTYVGTDQELSGLFRGFSL